MGYISIYLTSGNHLSEMIKERLTNINPQLNKELINPINCDMAPAPITNIIQTGRNAVAVGTINGDVHFH